MRVVRYYVTVDMLTVNREPRFEIPGIRGSLTTSRGPKEAQAEFRWTIIGDVVG